MQKSYFGVRFSNRTFERFSGLGYIDAGGTPEQYEPLNNVDFGLYLCFAGYIRDDADNVTGCYIKDRESGTIHEIFPGKVYNISVWTTTVDDDGCPEDICISYYVELVPCSE